MEKTRISQAADPAREKRTACPQAPRAELGKEKLARRAETSRGSGMFAAMRMKQYFPRTAGQTLLPRKRVARDLTFQRLFGILVA